MYSASLCKERFLEIRRLLKAKAEKSAVRWKNATGFFWNGSGNAKIIRYEKNISELILPLMNLCGELEDFLEEEPDGEVHEKIAGILF